MVTVEIKKIVLSKIRLNPDNPRRISAKSMDYLVKSLREFPEMMEMREIVVDETMTVLGGNMRLLALRKIGVKECVAKIVKGLAPKQKREFIIKDNSFFGEWNMDELANSWSDLPLVGWGVDLPEDWLKEQNEIKDAEPQIDKAAELQKKWQTETGQLWAIGEHRLLVGDSTKREDVARVMGGEKAALCGTSPPYADQREYGLGEFDFMALYKGFIDNTGHCNEILVNLGMKHEGGKVIRYWDEWLAYCESIGLPLFGWYVWDQLSGFPGDYHGRLARSHEFVFHFHRDINEANKWIKTTGESKKRGISGKRFRQRDGSLKEVGSPESIGQDYKIPDSVIRIGREMARGIHTQSHPAVFPVEFASFLINTWSKEGEISYDPFLGSGTTMVACQNLNRKCRGIEISPAYCAVILERMADAFPKIDIKRIE